METLRIKTPMSKHRSHYGGEQKVLTTMDFGQISVLDYHTILPRDKWNVKGGCQILCAPLVNPTWGDIYFNTASCAVPIQLLDDYFNTLISGKNLHRGRIVQDALCISQQSVLEAFIRHLGLFLVAFVQDSSGAYVPRLVCDSAHKDVMYRYFGYMTTYDIGGVTFYSPIDEVGVFDVNASEQTFRTWKHYDACDYILTFTWNNKLYLQGIRFGAEARHILDLFRQLGYRQPPAMYTLPPTVPSSQLLNYLELTPERYPNQKVSLYPFLAYLRAYSDMLSQPSLYNKSFIHSLLEKIRFREQKYIDIHGEMNVNAFIEVLKCFQEVTIQFEMDRYARATSQLFDTTQYGADGSVVDSDSDLDPTFRFVDNGNSPITKTTQVTVAPSGTVDNTPLQQYVSGDSAGFNVSPYWHKFFDSCVRYLTRNKLVGGKLTEQLRATFGVNNPFEDINLVKPLHVSRQPFFTEQINCTADSFSSDGQKLSSVGDYAGQLKCSDGINFKYSSDVHAIGLILCWLSVRPLYVQNMDRDLLHLSDVDFYKPDFDGLGYAQGITLQEVFNNRNDVTHAMDGKTLFGLEPLYDEYRNIVKNRVTGDFMRLAGMTSWFTGRLFYPYMNAEECSKYHQKLRAETSYVRNYAQATDEFTPIFQDNSDSADHFLVKCMLNLSVSRSVADSVNAYGLEEGDYKTDVNGHCLH